MNIFDNLYASLIAQTSSNIANLKLAGFLNPDADYMEWDAHAATAELESKDLVGLKSYSLDDDDGLLTASVAVMVSTYNDAELYRMRKVINYLFDFYALGNSFRIISAEDGSDISWF